MSVVFENTQPWRVGRKVGRTIYLQLADEPSDNDILIGVMDSREIAAEAVRAHNALLNGEVTLIDRKTSQTDTQVADWNQLR